MRSYRIAFTHFYTMPTPRPTLFWIDNDITKYRVRHNDTKPHTFVLIFAKYWPIFCGKFVINWLLRIPPHLNLDTLSVFVNIRRRYRMGQKLSLCFSFKLWLHFFSMHRRLAWCYCASSTQFLKTIILQGSAAIRFRCGEICHKSSLKIVCWA